MKVNILRKVDYYIGIPACFLLSIICRLQQIFSSKETGESDPRGIIFLEFSEMGSAIMAYSAMRKAKEIYPDATLYFWTFKTNEEILYILDILPKNNIITVRNSNMLVLFIDLSRNLLRIWKARIDVVIDMELFSRFSSILSFLSGAKTRVGFYRFSLEGLYRGSLHTHKVSYNPYMHISKNFLSLVYASKTSVTSDPLPKISLINDNTSVPTINADQQIKEKIWAKLKSINNQINIRNKIIILNPGINEVLPLRKWPLENYIRLSQKLLQDPEAYIVAVGIKSQSCMGDMMRKEIPSARFINLIGETSIEELIGLYNTSHLFISHDSGAAVLASLTFINTIILFGPETPVLYAPLSTNKVIFYANFTCSPCVSAYNHRNSLCKDNKCLKVISVEDIYVAAKKILDE